MAQNTALTWIWNPDPVRVVALVVLLFSLLDFDIVFSRNDFVVFVVLCVE